MKYRYLFAFLFVVTLDRCFAQYTFQQLDNSAGLSNSCINTIYNDSDNLLWFGTWDGLDFYDGRTVHVFNYERADPKSNAIASNVIYQVEEDKQRNIWAGTVEGISKFNKNTGVFSNYFYSKGKVVSNGYNVAINSKGQVYAARRNGSQLFVYDEKTDQFKKMVIQNLPDFTLLHIFFDDQGRLWLLKDKGKLEVFRTAGSMFVKIEGYSPVDSIDNAFYCNHQLFYTTRSKELYKISDGLKKVKLTTMPHEVRAMTYFNKQYVFAWSSQGIGVYSENFHRVNSITNSIPLLQNVRVTSLSADRNNLLWAGTDGNGAIKITPKENQFGLMQQLANGRLFHVPVRAFCEVNNELWIGTKGNGIVEMKNWDRRNVSFSDIRTFHTNVDLLDNCVYAIQPGRDSLVYVGSDAPGVTVYNAQTTKFVKWEEIDGSSRFGSFGSVHCILNDSDGSLWLGLNEDGLVHLKISKTGRGKLRLVYLKQYKYDGSSNGPGNNVIYSLAQGKDGLLWIGCRYGGLSLFDKQTGRFRTLKAFRYPGSLSNNDVLSLFIDAKDRLWVGTSFGLNWVNESEAADSPTPVFRKLYVDDGLPNNTIHAINGDGAGNIWLSTNKGLAKIDPQSLSVVQYKESDGLQSDEFSDNATWKNTTGMLFFGGIYGFNYFLPAAIRSNEQQPPLLLNGVQLAGKTSPETGLTVLTKNGAVDNQHFTLMPGDNYFELNLQPVTYTQQQKCQYASFLKGNDKTWHYMGNQERIVYNNIPPGNYTLMIKWSNGEGTWTNGVAAFSISVKQYFWLSTPAFVAYLLVLFAGTYVYLSYKKKRFMVTQELRVEHMLREKDEKVHQEQLNFFTNIAHELQTPLTLILGSLERFIFKNKGAETREAGRFLSIAKQEASRLQYLVQQLMEFRKAEAGRLENYYENFDVSAFLGNIAGLFVALIDEKNLDFSWQIEPGLVLRSDRDKLEKVVFNLLSNAFKYTGRGHYIIFTVNALPAENILEITVANSGCKLTSRETERLFERFFVADGKEKNHNNTGIGLAFTRQLVQMLGGEVSSALAKEWISFKVTLPLTYSNAAEMPEDGELPTGPSYLMDAMTKVPGTTPVAGNNKKAMVSSFEQKEKRSVLIVEDDHLIRFLLNDILREGYVIYESATGLEAMELMKRIMPDIIVSDVMMPDMDGLELCRLVKNTTESCHVPFILLSARTTIDHQTEGYDCGADAYIPKPFQTEHLLVRIQKLLEYRDKIHQAFRLNNAIAKPARVEALNDNDRNFIEKVTRLIEDNIGEDLDSAFLERALNLSKIQVYRKLKTLSDMTPTELIRYVRLQKASGLLLNTDLTVNEVFYRTGFNNKTYFFREFKKLYNCPPNDYRSVHRLPNLH